MKIVHFEDFFHPDAGYQLNILPKYMVLAGHDVTIVTSELTKMPNYLIDFFRIDDIAEKDKKFTEEFGVRIIRVPIYSYYSGRSIYKPGVFKLIDSLKPDVLFVHGEDTYIGIRVIMRLFKFKYAVLFDDHMVDMASKNKLAWLFRLFYRTFVTPQIRKYKSVVIRTVDDDFIFRRYNISKEQSPLIEFGSDLLKFHPDEEVKRIVRSELMFSMNDFIVIYAGKTDESKGGQFLADTLLRKLHTSKSVKFLVIGNFSGTYGKNVKETLEKSENTVVILPTQPYSQLNRYFQCADIAVFPKQCSLTYFDVQACGLPVVLENNIINVKRIDHNNGMLFISDDIEDFTHKIELFADMNEDSLKEMKKASEQYIINNYSYNEIAQQYMDIIEGVYRNFNRCANTT